jgi:hypothetical protein
MKTILFIFGFLSVLFIPISIASASDYITGYTDTTDNQRGTDGNNSNSWVCQSFTSTSTNQYTLDYLRLKLSRRTTVAGVFSFRVYNIDGSEHPTGTALSALNNYDSTGVTTDFGGDWYNINMPGTIFSTSTKYAFCFSWISTADARLWIKMDDTSPGYTNGFVMDSADGGTSYTNRAEDSYFEIWGTIYTPPPPPVAGAGELSFPEILIIILAVFLLCLIIERGGDMLIIKIDDNYKNNISY